MDILVDLRLVPKGLRSMTRLVEGMGFRLKGVSPEGIGHRFERDGLVIDLLAPDGMGERADIGTVGSAKAFTVRGGSWALPHVVSISVRLNGESGHLPVPDLPRAILLKAAARDSLFKRDKDLEDLAFLLGLIEDAELLRNEYTRNELACMKRRTELLDPDNDAWDASLNPDNGLAVLRTLCRNA